MSKNHKPLTEPTKMFVRKGDEVVVIAGDDKGKRGKVLNVLPKRNMVIVEGVKLVKKHQKPRQTSQGTQVRGGIIDKNMPLHASNVMVVCPRTGKVGKIRRQNIDNKWVRIHCGSGEQMP